MLQHIIQLASQNQFLTGGLSAMALGWAAYQAKSIPVAIFNAARGGFLVHVALSEHKIYFDEIDEMLARHRIQSFIKNFEFSHGRLATGFGRGWARWDGVWISYNKAREQRGLTPVATLDVTFYTRDVARVRRFFEEAVPVHARNDLNVMIDAGVGWSAMRRRKRKLSSVFVEGDVGRRMVERLSWFQANADWYERRGVPRKIGFVLHGPPGTGKTSLIQAVASEMGFDIRYLRSLHGVADKIVSIDENALLVIEDIDALAENLNREPAAANDSKPARGAAWVMHEILNTFDGMQTPDGLKFVITTNHLDRLDPAILRPGRIDHVYEIGPLGLNEARRMFRAFYDRDGLKRYAPTTGARLQHMFSTMTAEEAEEELDQLACGVPLAASPPSRGGRGRAPRAA